MTKDELDAFLAVERTCRVATSSPQGPHLTALWFGLVPDKITRWDFRKLPG